MVLAIYCPIKILPFLTASRGSCTRGLTRGRVPTLFQLATPGLASPCGCAPQPRTGRCSQRSQRGALPRASAAPERLCVYSVSGQAVYDHRQVFSSRNIALIHLHQASKLSGRDVSRLRPRDTNKSPSAALLKIATLKWSLIGGGRSFGSRCCCAVGDRQTGSGLGMYALAHLLSNRARRRPVQYIRAQDGICTSRISRRRGDGSGAREPRPRNNHPPIKSRTRHERENGLAIPGVSLVAQ